MNSHTDIRPLDYVLTAVMVALAAALGFANMQAGSGSDLAHTTDSQSALMIPVFMVAALPILWRRRNILAAIGVSFVVVAASLPMFGWVTRCGFALPLLIAMAYAVARFAGSRQNQLIGLAGVLALQVVTLVKDSATGGLGGALATAVLVAAVFYGIGLLVQIRVAHRPSASTLNLDHVNA